MDYDLATLDGVNIYLAPTTATGYTMIGYHSIGNKTFTLADPGGTITPK